MTTFYFNETLVKGDMIAFSREHTNKSTEGVHNIESKSAGHAKKANGGEKMFLQAYADLQLSGLADAKLNWIYVTWVKIPSEQWEKASNLGESS